MTDRWWPEGRISESDRIGLQAWFESLDISARADLMIKADSLTTWVNTQFRAAQARVNPQQKEEGNVHNPRR